MAGRQVMVNKVAVEEKDGVRGKREEANKRVKKRREARRTEKERERRDKDEHIMTGRLKGKRASR